MYVYYVCVISLSHLPIRRYAKIVVRIVLVSVVRLYYDHSIMITLRAGYNRTTVLTAGKVRYEMLIFYGVYHKSESFVKARI